MNGRRGAGVCAIGAIGIASSLHMAAAIPHCPYIEFLPASLTVKDVPMQDGGLPLPHRPGLGVDLNPEALDRYRIV